jgi:ketosteroid isomerase-like protein
VSLPLVVISHCEVTMLSLRRFLPLLLVAAAMPAIGQSSTASIAGKWAGVLDIVHGDGSVDPDNALFELKIENGVLTGMAGNAANQMSAVTNAHVDGSSVRFDVPSSGSGPTVHFELTLADDRLRGAATGLPVEAGGRIVVETRRADANWKTAEPVPHAADQLFANVAALDKELFDAYNNCDLTTMGRLTADDLEFYHDRTGLAVGKQVFLDAIKNNICGKVHRELLPGTLEVHRLAEFGAVEIGMHRFTHPGNPSDGVGQAKFITVWRYKDGAWQMTRAISYDHEAAPGQ